MVLWRHLVPQRIEMRQSDLLLFWAHSFLAEQTPQPRRNCGQLAPPSPCILAPLPLQPSVTTSPRPRTPLFNQLVQLVPVLDSSVIASAESSIKKKTTANATILIINTASSVWMSSEHVGLANAGYDPKFRRMTFDSRTLCYLNLILGTWSTFLWHLYMMSIQRQWNKSKPSCISVKFCVGCRSVTNGCPLGNIHPSVHLPNPLPPAPRVRFGVIQLLFS